MDADHSELLHTTIEAELDRLYEATASRPAWYESWKALGSDTSDEDRLRVYQAIRDSKLLSDDAGFYLVGWQVDTITSKRAESALRHLEDELETLEADQPDLDKEDTKEEGWEQGEESDWEAGSTAQLHEQIMEEYRQAWAVLFLEELQKHGESEIAELFRTDPEEFERKNELGRRYFHAQGEPVAESEEPEWLDGLVLAVGRTIEPDGMIGPLGVIYRVEENYWEVDVFPSPVELVGGAEDGAVVSPAYSLDIELLRKVLTRVDDTGWNVAGWAEGDGPFVWIEGSYQGHEIYLRVLAQAPEGEEPGAKFRIPGKQIPPDAEL